MRSYIERAKDFIADIFPYISDWEDVFNVADEVDIFNEEHNRKVLMRHGLSRIAFITSDYVIKYDFDPYEIEIIGGCEAEYKFYKNAQSDGFAYLFAEITPYHYKGHAFYIMPRIRGIGTGGHGGYYFMEEEEKNYCEDHKLGDLHINNYGFRNGKICIVDYAYQIDDEEEEEK